MQNKVGDKVPSESEITRQVEAVDAISSKTESYTVQLTDEERKRLVRMRPGGERIVALMGALARQHGLVLPGADADAMEADLLLAQRLARLETATADLARRVDSTVMEAHAEAWYAATAIYTALSRIADTDPSLKNALKPAIEFFATGRRKGGSGGATTPPAG